MNVEHELRSLAVEFPAEPDLRPAVLARIEARPRRRLWPAVALATIAAVSALLAIPQTRAAILRILEIGGVRVERVETQPQGERSPFIGGRRVTLAAARGAVAFEPVRPSAAARVYLDRGIPGGMVSFVWNGFVLSQWEGAQTPHTQKNVGPGGSFREVDVAGATGVWITGAPHEVVYLDRHGEPRFQTRRLAGNVLIWERGPVTFRLEGASTLEQALRIARNL